MVESKRAFLPDMLGRMGSLVGSEIAHQKGCQESCETLEDKDASVAERVEEESTPQRTKTLS